MTLMDTFVDRLLRRPRGPLARWMWRDMKSHHDIFRDTLAALNLDDGDYLVEIGCGGGSFAARALESGCRATAVDHSADMVALTKSANPAALADGRLEVIEADAAALPLPDAHVTCATAMNVLFFVDTGTVLAELHRVLRPGGRLVVHTVAPDPPRTLMPAPVAKRARFHSDTELAELLETAGFDKVAVTRKDNTFQLVTAVRPA
ncbi:class I SAM-dependent methyltransferase [Nocardia cyriacigeorgica]|uniref:Probable S-adenosylmethionine-dependent methyltransferase MSMEG_2350 n=1 Tax=Nocardia cyriacigeorgica TaxID=135487 RepID=A0A4V6IC08_9NOCA|nr:methyltransferase domain-containing protein [Nocardia cyriacigeorgica]VFA97833.1 Probable S-adenosylmethionine-dependent methyltransferase MSMEG_2350 [Nocardia cyriacigeorgica]